MKRIDRGAALQHYADWEKRDFHVDPRIPRQINKACDLYLLQLEDEDSFFSLIWQEIEPTRFLTDGKSRTLGDVADRFLDGGRTFEALAEEKPWFQPCLDIDLAFAFDAFGWVAIVRPSREELNQTPRGTFYIQDGVHKTFVLAKRILTGETTYVPVTAFLIIPRP